MKPGISLICLLLALAGCVTPPGAIKSATERVTLGDYSVQVPAAGWLKETMSNGMTFFSPSYNMYGGKLAIFAVKPVEKIADRPAFLAYVKGIAEHATEDFNSFKSASQKLRYRYKTTDKEQGGHYVVITQADYDLSVLTPRATVTMPYHEVKMRAWDPTKPGRMVVLAVSYHGSSYNKKTFNDLANGFFRSLEKAKPGAEGK